MALEADESVSFSVVLSGPQNQEIRADYQVKQGSALATNDLSNPIGTIIFPPGQTEKEMTLGILRDGLVEGLEDFSLHLTNFVGVQPGPLNDHFFQILDEQIPVAWDYAFPFLSAPAGAAKLQDESFIIVESLDFHSQRIRRLRMDGSELFTFSWGGDLHVQQLREAWVATDGSVSLGGEITVNGGASYLPMVRLSIHGGVPDHSQVEGTFLAFQSSGQAILQSQGLLRLTPSGAKDQDFASPVGVIPELIVLADDSFVMIHRPDLVEGEFQLRRLTKDGLPDDLFPSFMVDPDALLLPTHDGGFVLSGRMQVEGEWVYATARFSAHGDLIWKNSQDITPRLEHAGKIYWTPARLPFAGLQRFNEHGQLDLDFIALPPQSQVLFGWEDKLYVVHWPNRVINSQSLRRSFANNARMTQISFAAPKIFIPENGGGHVKLTRTGDTTGVTTLDLTPLSAIPEGMVFPQRLTFEPLESEKTIYVAANNDSLPEADEVMPVELTGFHGAVPGEFSLAEWRLTDDDGRPGNLILNPNKWILPWQGAIVRDMLELQDGRVLICGTADVFTSGDKSLYSFSAEGILETNEYPFEPVFALAQQSTGKILIAGELRSGPGCAARLNLDGTRDSSFQVLNAYSCHGVYSLVVQPDDRIIVGGALTDYSNDGNGIVRLLPNGGRDPSFSTAPHDFYGVRKILLQPDGKILLLFDTSSLGHGFTLARLHPDGSLDHSFAPYKTPHSPTVFNSALAASLSGQIFVSTSSFSGANTHLVRLQTNGLADPSFTLEAALDGSVADIRPSPDGKILVCGAFQTIGGLRRGGLARLSQDGTVDPAFDPGDGAMISSMPRLRNGSLLVAGRFQTFNGVPANGLALIKEKLDIGFLIPTSRPGIFSTVLIGEPARSCLLQESSGLQNWTTLSSETFDAYTRTIELPLSQKAKFYRAIEQ